MFIDAVIRWLLPIVSDYSLTPHPLPLAAYSLPLDHFNLKIVYHSMTSRAWKSFPNW